jgi:hypothetical protein
LKIGVLPQRTNAAQCSFADCFVIDIKKPDDQIVSLCDLLTCGCFTCRSNDKCIQVGEEITYDIRREVSVGMYANSFYSNSADVGII